MRPDIVVLLGNLDLKKSAFAFLKDSERETIERNIADDKSIGMIFKNAADEVLFYAVIDIEKDAVHIHAAAGSFPRHYKILTGATEVLACKLNKKRVTFTTKIKAVKELGRRAGYVLNSFGDMEKAIC